MSEFNNAYDWTSNLNYQTKLYKWGKLLITNRYNGTAIEGVDNSFRDAEDFYLLYDYPLLENLFANSEINYKLISDRNIDENNKIERLSGLLGISGKLSLVNYKLLAGIENNTQATAKASGEIIKASIILDEWNTDDYKIKTKADATFLFLNDDRTNQDINAIFDLSKFFARTNFFNFGVNYRLQGRNFIQSSDSSTIPVVEGNTDHTISGFVKGNLKFNNYININYNANIENINILRNYLKVYSNVMNSNLNRYYNELRTNLDINTDLTFSTNKHNLGFQINGGNETYRTEEFKDVGGPDPINTGLLELQKDNYTENMKLLYSGTLAFSEFDTINTSVLLSKTKYDTPSIFNNDDRDEIRQIVSLEYKHEMSSILSFFSRLDYSQNHLVFIKMQRSSQNNWNRILSLTTGIKILTKKIYYAPLFEILANYTVYDFELNNQSQSYSFRQLSYKDTILINLTPKYYISNKTSFRMYEQGKLLWNSFTETPQQRNLEFALYSMLFSKMNEKITVGCGNRFYYLKHGSISSTNWGIATINIFSFSPEASITLELNSIILRCYGWLEHKYQQNNLISTIPNIYLQTTYKL